VGMIFLAGNSARTPRAGIPTNWQGCPTGTESPPHHLVESHFLRPCFKRRTTGSGGGNRRGQNSPDPPQGAVKHPHRNNREKRFSSHYCDRRLNHGCAGGKFSLTMVGGRYKGASGFKFRGWGPIGSDVQIVADPTIGGDQLVQGASPVFGPWMRPGYIQRAKISVLSPKHLSVGVGGGLFGKLRGNRGPVGVAGRGLTGKKPRASPIFSGTCKQEGARGTGSGSYSQDRGARKDNWANKPR